MKSKKKGLSIGTKVYSLLAVLILSFIVYNILANLGLNEAKNSIRNLTNVYLELQKENEVVSKNVAEVRLSSNLIVLTPDENTAKQVTQQVPTLVETINASLTKMHAIAQELGNEELMNALMLYVEKTYMHDQNISNTVEFYLNGDKPSAVGSNNAIFT